MFKSISRFLSLLPQLRTRLPLHPQLALWAGHLTPLPRLKQEAAQHLLVSNLLFFYASLYWIFHHTER
jgi:hypothetical protein